jgi:phage terminase large subunit-like protein
MSPEEEEDTYLLALADLELEERAVEAKLENLIPRYGVTAAGEVHAVPKALLPLCNLWDRIHAGEQVNALVAAPPRMFKTTTCFHGAAREMKRRPGWRYGYATYNINTARERSAECRVLAERSGLWVSEEQVVRESRWDAASSLNLWSTSNGSTGRFMGAGGGGIGAGLDLLHIDDPIKNEDEAFSPTVLERRWRWIAGTMMSRLEPGASFILSHHRWSTDDPIGRVLAQIEGGFGDVPEEARALLNARQWEVIELAAFTGLDKYGDPVEDLDDWLKIVMSTATPLFGAGRFTMEELAVHRAAMGDDLFGAKYMQRPPRAGSYLFPDTFPVWQGAVSPDGQEMGLTWKEEWFPVPEMREGRSKKFLVLGADTAGSESSTADFTAVVLLACWYEPDGQGGHLLHGDVLYVWYDRFETTAVVDHVASIARAFGSAPLGFESQGEGRAQLRFLKRDYPDLNIHEITVSSSKRVRATPCGGAAKNGRLRVPVTAPWLAEFRRQVCKFTGHGGALKDDIPDALSHAWNLASMISPPMPPRVGGERKIRGRTGVL